MNGTVSRRVFVGSIAAGLPLVVGASSDSLPELPTGRGHRHVAAGEVPDPMFEHTIRQLATIANRVRRHGVTAADARIVAAHVSTLAIYAGQSDLDARMATAMRDLVRAKSRGETLDLGIDAASVRARLKRYGVDVDEGAFDTLRPDDRTQARAVDDLYQSGLTGMFVRIASTCERTAIQLDRYGARLAGIRLVQDDDWRAQLCPALWADVERAAAEAAAACAARVYIPQLDGTCAIAEMVLQILLAAYLALCF